MSHTNYPASKHPESDSANDTCRVEEQNPAAAASTSTSSTGGHAPGTRLGCVCSTDLLRGEKTVDISHNGSTYRLQATRLGKLILTK